MAGGFVPVTFAINVETVGGDDLPGVAGKAITLAQKLGMAIRFDFNGIKVFVMPNDTPADAAREFDRKWKQKHGDRAEQAAREQAAARLAKAAPALLAALRGFLSLDASLGSLRDNPEGFRNLFDLCCLDADVAIAKAEGAEGPSGKGQATP